MPSDPRNPQPGDLALDATELSDIVRDRPPDATVGTRQEREGMAEALEEIQNNQEAFGDRAGVTPTDVTSLAKATADIARIRKFKRPAKKLVEMLEESEALIDDSRHAIISAIASSIDRRAKIPGNEDLLAQYQKTREYRSAIAVKAAKTRKEKAKKEGTPT